MAASSSYASVATQNASITPKAGQHTGDRAFHPNRSDNTSTQTQKRSPSPTHVPMTESEHEAVYVLTLLTDTSHHDRMTALRSRYFPKHINKLAAHLTLFHALPGSKLESSIIPVIQAVAKQTAPFKVHAAKPFRLKRGVAISVAKQQGGQQAQAVHRALQQPWVKEGFLSEQDAGGCRVHYTIMNKVDDEGEVRKAVEEVQADWKGDYGMADGLGLWRYDRGWWRWERRFDFQSDSQPQP